MFRSWIRVSMFMVCVCLVFGIVPMSVYASDVHRIGEGQKDEPLPPSPKAPPQINAIGGEPAASGDWPWMTALYPKGTDNFLCGGALIDPEWVLTAAHCLSPTAQLDVVIGKTKLTDTDGERITVEEIIIYPSYSQDNAFFSYADIALLHLEQPSTQTPIQIASSDEYDHFEPRTPATVTGWGAIDHTDSKEAFPDHLQQVTVPIVSNEICRATVDYITSYSICAGYETGEYGSCQGDSGGPLMVPDGEGSWLHVGIVSWAYLCAAPGGFYSVYTRTTSFYDWIMTHVKEHKRPHLDVTSYAVQPFDEDRDGDGDGIILLKSAAPGEPITFTVRVDNTGTVPVHDLEVTNELPTKAEYIKSSQQGQLRDGIVHWQVSEPLEPGDTLTRTFTVRSDESIINQTYAVSGQSSAGEVKASSRTEQHIPIDEPALSVTVEGDVEKTVDEPYTIELRAENAGKGPAAAASDVTLALTLPPNTTHINGGDLDGNVVSWHISELEPGTTTTKKVVVRPTKRGLLIVSDYYLLDDQGQRTVGIPRIVGREFE